MAELEAVIGLEIHVQLSTRTKMFCGCELSFGDEPNVHTCPVCLAHPGVLPVPNEEAIRSALKIAAALECEVAPRSIFHRKNYFYPDNPKAYQISQYDIPLARHGRLGEGRAGKSLSFNIAHAAGNAALALVAGPAMVRTQPEILALIACTTPAPALSQEVDEASRPSRSVTTRDAEDGRPCSSSTRTPV